MYDNFAPGIFGIDGGCRIQRKGASRRPWGTLVALLCGLVQGFGSTPALAQEPVLEFNQSGSQTLSLSLEELSSRLDEQTITFYNPFLAREKTYRAFPVADLLDHIYGESWRAPDYSDIAFVALDGYEAVSQLSILEETGGFIAFDDVDWEDGWEPVGRRLADPGPFFLVWTEPHQTTANAYPWPWQVASLNLLRFKDQYPAVLPAGAAADSPAYQGFEIYRARCLRCHAISQQGGKIGPDLNEPMNITTYRSKDMIKAFIYQASKFRHTHMPDHLDLDDSQLESLYQYLAHQQSLKGGS